MGSPTRQATDELVQDAAPAPRHDRLDGKAAPIFSDPPLAGLELMPLAGADGSFELTRAQERYVFRRTR